MNKNKNSKKNRNSIIEDILVNSLVLSRKIQLIIKKNKRLFNTIRFLIGLITIIILYISHKSIFILILLSIIEIFSCFLLKGMHVKSWLEILSFTTILTSLKFGPIIAFWYFAITYIFSMFARLSVHPDEIPGIFIRGCLLTFIPSILSNFPIIIIGLITLTLQSLMIFTFYYIFGERDARVIMNPLLSLILSLALLINFSTLLG
jgi:hypothetical protein